jgi:hypothetical protein
VDFRKQQREHAPVHINGTAVEKVESFKFLCVHITDDQKWSTHTNSVMKKAQQCHFKLRMLKKIVLPLKPSQTFSLPGITAWYGNCTARNRRALQRVVWSAQRIPAGKLFIYAW